MSAAAFATKEAEESRSIRCSRSSRMHRRLVALLAAALSAQSGATAARAETPTSSEANRTQKLALADRGVSALELGAGRVQAELRRARVRHEGPRGACLDDVLTRFHVATRSGHAMRDTLAVALTSRDDAAAERELTRVTWLG